MYPNSVDVMQWLADTNLLDMIVDKLCPSVSSSMLASVLCSPDMYFWLLDILLSLSGFYLFMVDFLAAHEINY